MIITAPPNMWAKYSDGGGDHRALPVVAFDTDVPPDQVAAIVCTRDGGLAFANDTEPAAGYVLEYVTLLPQ